MEAATTTPTAAAAARAPRAISAARRTARNGNKKGPRLEPGRPGANLNPSNQGGVSIESHGTNDEDRPPHAHVNGDEGNKDCRIGPNGKPISGQRDLTPREAAAVAANLPAIRKELNKVGRSASRLEAEGNLPGAGNTSKKKK